MNVLHTYTSHPWPSHTAHRLSHFPDISVSYKRGYMSTARISPSATAISATFRHISLTPPSRRAFLITLLPPLVIGRRARNYAPKIYSKASEPLEVCAKESLTTPNKLGDCESIDSPTQKIYSFYYLIVPRRENWWAGIRIWCSMSCQ